MTTTGKRRLLKLAALLEKDAKNKKGVKFDLKLWGHSNDPSMPLDCGTTACAVGLACLSGAFKHSGLSWIKWESTGIIPAFNGALGFDATKRFFDISGDETLFLFAPGRYPPSQQKGADGELAVAKRIRDFVAGRVAP